jgi:hypothetical protein
MKVHLTMRDLSGFRAAFERLVKLTAREPGKLLEGIRTTEPYQNRLRSSQRSEFLSIVEVPLHQLLEGAEGAAKGDCAIELARLLSLQGRHSDAIPFAELAVTHAATDQDKEERSLQLAETLRLAKRLDEAKALYTQLSASTRETVSKRAQAGLILLGVSKP